jgi:hypothetical protein
MSRLVWATTTAIRVGDLHIGVRSATPDIRDALESALALHVVDNTAAPASHAIHAPSDLPTGARPLYRVFEECSPVFVTPSLDRAVAVLAGYLADYLPPEETPTTTVHLDAAAVIRAEGAILIPWQVPYLQPASEQRLRHVEAKVLERRHVRVDTTTREVDVPASVLVEGGPLGRTGSVTPGGRYPIRGWVFLGRQGNAPFTRSQAVAHAMAIAYRRTTSAANLPLLASLLDGMPIALAPDADETLRLTAELLATE